MQTDKRTIPLRNSFSLNEWTGALGDLGILLPLAFALILYNGFSPNTLFLLWGAAYVMSGFIFKIPLSVQPLKVMSVIAIAQGLSPQLLSNTAFFYGLFFILISLTGVIKWLQKWFSVALVTGIQLGVGLVLGRKAIELLYQNGIFLALPSPGLLWTSSLFCVVLIILLFAQWKKKQALGITFVAIIGLILIVLMNLKTPLLTGSETLLTFTPPDLSLLLNVTLLLMLPQLPLTLGNSVFAADDTCHQLWDQQASRVSPTRLGLSVGISNTFIGLLGGFPMCHGAGGMAAHSQFGAKTGGSTIIMGCILILLAILPFASTFIFLIPVPILAALLILDSWRMVTLMNRLSIPRDYVTASVVGGLTLISGNLSIALLAGLISERVPTFSLSLKNLMTPKELL